MARRRAAQLAVSRPALALALSIGAALVAFGCGDGDSSVDREPAGSRAGAEASDFPRPYSRSFREFIRNMPQGPELVPSVGLLEPGPNRLAFALFDRGSRQIGGLDAALYLALGLDEPVHGPFRARYERITVSERFRSRQSSNPDVARSFYVAHVRLSEASSYTAVAVSKLGGRWVASTPTQLNVTRGGSVPAVGDRAVRVHTPTAGSPAELRALEGRVPPDTMHEVDLADALDEGRPVLLLFAAAARCQSRLCAPVTDVAEQVNAELGREVEFIHVEVYRAGDPERGVNPQVRAWRLPSEPFAFAINSNGRIEARLEGAFSARELRAAVRTVVR
jgi:hypothetical protein